MVEYLRELSLAENVVAGAWAASTVSYNLVHPHFNKAALQSATPQMLFSLASGEFDRKQVDDDNSTDASGASGWGTVAADAEGRMRATR